MQYLWRPLKKKIVYLVNVFIIYHFSIFYSKQMIIAQIVLLVWTKYFVQTIVVAIFGQNFATLFLTQSLSNRLEI